MDKIKSEKINDGIIVYNKEPEKRETTPGIHLSAGEIYQDYDEVTWKDLIRDYTHMRNGGAVESTTVSILKYPILRAGYTINHKDEVIRNYIQWAFDMLIDSFGESDGFAEFLNHLFLALEYGCSFFEKVYKNGVYTPENKITNIINRLAPFKPETIWKFHYNAEMQFSGITHERRQGDSINSFIDIPASKLFFYSHNTEYGDPRGRSELRPVRNLYTIKKDILLATARAQQRGAGIPEIHFKKTGITEADKAKADLIGRTIGNMKGGYISTDEDIEIKLHSLQIQGSPEALLEFINRDLFFNTLTEFMTSGIGQSGSRSATSEHKGSYELKCGVITLALEKRINLLIKEIIDISCYAPVEEYPTFKFNALQQTDIVSAADSIIKFYDKAILNKQKGDEEFIRGLFNMPEKIEQIEVPALSMRHNKLELSNKTFRKSLSVEEQNEFILNNFDSDNVNNLYLEMQKESEDIINGIINKYALYIAKQKESGNKVEDKYNAELVNRLNKIYKTGYSEGVSAVNKEIDKISAKKLDSSSKTEDLKKGISQSLTRYAGRLLFNVKTVVEDKIDTDYIEGQGTVSEYVVSQNFENGFKTDKRTLIEKTTDGYLNGRADTLSENKDKIELYFYNSILDTRLCDNCAKLTGAVITEDEAVKLGLMPGRGRVNPECLGGIGSCRCILMPYKIKGEFLI